MSKSLVNLLAAFLTIACWLLPAEFAGAHHVLGRPAYSLNEDSNTPPAMQVETQIGDYLVTYMVFPAFPRPGEAGRINFYASRIDDGTPYDGRVTFSVRTDSWASWFGIGGQAEKLGTQPPDDNVFRQGYRIGAAGDYLISAEFQVGGTRHVVDFPLRIGEPPLIGPLGIAVGGLLVVLLAVTLIQRRRSMTGKIRGAVAGKNKT